MAIQAKLQLLPKIGLIFNFYLDAISCVKNEQTSKAPACIRVPDFSSHAETSSNLRTHVKLRET